MCQALTMHGEGLQTRSLSYVDDTIEGFVRLMAHEVVPGPVNIGNPEEVTVRRLAERIRSLAGSTSPIAYQGRPVDDPERRCPDITLAHSLLGGTRGSPRRGPRPDHRLVQGAGLGKRPKDGQSPGWGSPGQS